jgi:CheY-like chemotaxis protein
MTTILVVEDEAIVAIDIAQRLKRGGYDAPAVAATGEAALRTLEELHPDLVLMDILLKGEKDGIETARAIKDQFDIPVVLLTGQADESTQERVKNTGAYGFILKPIDTASLLPTIELALARHAFEVQLKESENRFRAVTDSAADAIFSMDVQGTVIYWNKAAERTFGWTADDITGQSVTAILPESAKAGFFKMLPALGTRETYVPPSFMPSFLQSQASPCGKRKRGRSQQQ